MSELPQARPQGRMHPANYPGLRKQGHSSSGWGCAFWGIPLAGYLGWGVAGHVDNVTPALIGGALTGAGIGFAQWLSLRRSLGVGLEWIVATGVGLAVGLTVGAMVVGYETTASKLAIMGAIQGAFVGVAQGMVLRSKFSLWHVWMVAMPVFFSIAWVVTDGVIDSGKQFTGLRGVREP